MRPLTVYCETWHFLPQSKHNDANTEQKTLISATHRLRSN